MVAQKRHPFETFVEDVLDKADRQGLDHLEQSELTVPGFHWLSTKQAANAPKKQKRDFALPLAERGTWLTALLYVFIQAS